MFRIRCKGSCDDLVGVSPPFAERTQQAASQHNCGADYRDRFTGSIGPNDANLVDPHHRRSAKARLHFPDYYGCHRVG